MSARAAVLWGLLRKEIRAYFDTPTAYVVTVVMLLVSGYLFSAPLFLANQASLEGFTGSAPLLLLFFVPAVTMRLYAEEVKSGTAEFLANLPVKDEDVVAAKFLAAMAVVLFLLAGTLVYPATLRFLGRPDPGATAGAYAGLAMTAGALASIGLWASSVTRNQITAFILSFLIGFALFLMGKASLFLPPSVARVTHFLGFDSHLAGIARGVLDTRDLVYYASLTGYFLYLSYLSVHGRRIRG